MYKYEKKSEELKQFNAIFSVKKCPNYPMVGMAMLTIFVTCIVAFLFQGISKAQASVFDINWECDPVSIECYTHWEGLGYDQFRMKYNGVDPNTGTLIFGSALANCNRSGYYEPGAYDILGYRGDGLYEGDSHGTCHCESLGYWAEDGIGYWHYRIWSDPPADIYQSWVVNETFRVPAYGSIDMHKTSSKEWSLNHPQYDFSNCVYDIYNTYNDAQQYINKISSITLDNNGYGISSANFLAEQTYYVRESNIVGQHGKNYTINNDIGSVKINHEAVSSVMWSDGSNITKDAPLADNMPVNIKKTDEQTHQAGVTEGSLESFENAHYRFEYNPNYVYSLDAFNNNSNPYWVMATDVNGSVSIQEKYRNNKIEGSDFFEIDNKIVCPMGSYYIKEVKAPVGYLLSDNEFICQVIPDENNDCKAKCVFYNAKTGEIIPSITDPQSQEEYVRDFEQVKKGDYKFVKVDDNARPMDGIPFKITSNTTNEWHIVVTDNNGLVDTSSSHVMHSYNTNYNDSLYDETSGQIKDEGSLNWECGCWFALNKKTKEIGDVDNNLGALPYDSYTIEEIKISKNEKFFPFAKRSFVITSHNYIIDGGTWVNSNKTCSTEAFSDQGNKNLGINEDVKAFDRIFYEGLLDNHQYQLKAWLEDNTSGNIINIKNGYEGNNYLINNFNAEKSYGYNEVSAVIDTRNYVGKSIVWMIEIYDFDTQSLLVDHKDILDIKETLHVNPPNISTYLLDFYTTSKNLDRRSDAKLIDTINYEHLIPGKTYSINAVLYNKSTNEPYLNEVSQQNVLANKDFVCDMESGFVSIEYIFDSTICPDNLELVSFVELKDDNYIVAQHKDISDEAQEVIAPSPKFNTKVFSKNGDKNLAAGIDNEFFDHIIYTKFPTKDFSIYSWFVFADNGLPVCDGGIEQNAATKAIEALVDALGGKIIISEEPDSAGKMIEVHRVKFDDYAKKIDKDKFSKINWEDIKHVLFKLNNPKVESIDGEFDINFSFDTSNLENRKIVCYTMMVCDEALLSSSNDLNDQNETFDIQKMPVAPTSHSMPQTGDICLVLVIALFLLSFLIFSIVKNKEIINWLNDRSE